MWFAGHFVRLWTAGGTLLSSATIDNADTPVAAAGGSGRWLFEDVADVVLNAGTYVIGADGGWNVDVFQIISTSITTDPNITWNESRFSTPASLGFPSNTTVGTQYFGPTLSLKAAPEPTTLALFGLGLAAAAGLARRRKQVR